MLALAPACSRSRHAGPPGDAAPNPATPSSAREATADQPPARGPTGAPYRPEEPRPCAYGRQDEGCEPTTVCAHVERDQPPQCVPFATEEDPLAPPFASGRSFWVGQHGRSAAGRSHSWRNDLYAVDFVPLRSSREELVVAPVDGQLRIHDGCEERDRGPDSTNDSPCGLGYGNHVRIWDGHNLILLAHLAQVTAQDGPVKRGQALGWAGSSGRAGYRHVHMTVTRPAPGQSPETILREPGWMGSIPTRVRYELRNEEASKLLWSDQIPAAELEAQAQRWLAP